MGGFLIGISKTGLKCQKQQIGLERSGIRKGKNDNEERNKNCTSNLHQQPSCSSSLWTEECVDDVQGCNTVEKLLRIWKIAEVTRATAVEDWTERLLVR